MYVVLYCTYTNKLKMIHVIMYHYYYTSFLLLHSFLLLVYMS